MLPLLETVKRNLAYLLLAAGVIWLAALFATSSVLLLWPAAACFASGALLKVRREDRFSAAWVSSSAIMGLVLSAYQSYAATLLISGEFVSIASISLVAFLAFAILHAILLYANVRSPETEE
jgi:hypothetical protein